jgi:hypothetical protein
MAVIMEDWIFIENLQPFVEVLAFLAGYALYDEDYDWVAIECGVKATDADADKWHTYAFAGTRPLAFDLACNLGSNVVSLRVTSDGGIPTDLAAQFNLLVLMCQSYAIFRQGQGPRLFR